MKTSIIKIYDNENETIDRYTVFTDVKEGIYHEALCLNDNPEHPQGFSQFSVGKMGNHLGKEITFNDLPDKIQKHIKKRLLEPDTSKV